MHEQMSGYKRMRREHQAALLKLEERCKADVDAHKAQLDREYEALLQQLSRELERLQVTHCICSCGTIHSLPPWKERVVSESYQLNLNRYTKSSFLCMAMR